MKRLCISIFALMMMGGCRAEAEGARIEPMLFAPMTAAKETGATETPSATAEASFTPSPTAVPTPHPAPEGEGTLIRVYKGERLLELWRDGALLHSCAAALGFSPEGHKEREGDGKTPEGEYYVCTRNDASRYYLSLGLSYPNEKDALDALAQGEILQSEYDAIAQAIREGRRPPWNTPLGGEIMIHGNGSGSDWTAGCIAVEDGDMDILWEEVPIGTAVRIYP